MALNIILLIAGAIVFIVSFIMPEMGSELEQVDPQLTRKQIRDMIDKEMGTVKDQVSEIVEETSNYSVEKTERALERLTNEKISAVSEYSDTVLEDIHKSHEEVMFLYDMLNNKHEDLKETASEVSTSVKKAKEAKRELDETVTVDTAILQNEPAPEEAEKLAEEMTESFHSETAKEFFARHKESESPSIDEIRASFQPMAFGQLSQVGEDERVFGGENQEEVSDGKELEQMDEEQVDAAIDELLGVAQAPEKVKENGPLDTEAAMDAALAALTAGTALQNDAANTKSAGTALENDAASATAADTAMENDAASVKDAGVALENDAAISQPEVFKQLEESISAMVMDQEHGSEPYAVDESQAGDLIPEKAPAKQGKKGKAAKSKEKPADITLQFGMDSQGSGNNNEKILALHKKGKSNIAIAKELGLGVGEVKLVLDLFKGM
ncbi:MAG: hypothetical protein K6E84_04705 [Lachnospiraceae bacterium]|nr:hypothetical protein [Lachnospiraceae bacterium]